MALYVGIERASTVSVVSHHLRWFDWERFSSRQNSEMKLGGLLGDVSFEGDVRPFGPLLRAGEIVHVGKGTSFGLGQYLLTPPDVSEGVA